MHFFRTLTSIITAPFVSRPWKRPGLDRNSGRNQEGKNAKALPFPMHSAVLVLAIALCEMFTVATHTGLERAAY